MSFNEDDVKSAAGEAYIIGFVLGVCTIAVAEVIILWLAGAI